MAKRVVDIGRRQVLLGAGGFALALPFMASLAEKSALGGDPVYTRRPRLFWFTTDHGGAFETNMFPDASLLTNKASLFPGHPIASGALRLVATVGRSRLCARAGLLEPRSMFLSANLFRRIHHYGVFRIS